MAGKGKGGCDTSPISQALALEEMADALSGHDKWAEDTLTAVQDNRNLDPAGYAEDLLSEIAKSEGSSESAFHQILGCRKELTPEQALCYLMAVRMRGDKDYRWTKDQMHSYLNSLSVNLGGKPISKYMVEQWVALHFHPAWEPRTEGQRPGQIVGNPMAAERHLMRNASRLRDEHEIVDALLDESREISGQVKGGDIPNRSRQGLWEKVASDAEASQVDSDAVNLEYQAYENALQRIIEKTGRVRPHRLPEGKTSEATKVLFALLGQKFNETLLKEGSTRYAQGVQLSGKEAEEWWRETMTKSLGILRKDLHSIGKSGLTYKVVTESSSTDVFDLIVTIQEPGGKPFHLTLQFKSYQDKRTDPASRFQLCTMGGVQKKDGNYRPRTAREAAEEIRNRLHNTGAFASISVDPTREGKTSDLRRADKVVHRAECLHPEIQKALTVKRLSKGFARRQPDGSRVAKVPVKIGQEEVTVVVRIDRKGKTSISGLNNKCWIPINTSTFLTETGARADHRLLEKLIKQERQNLQGNLQDDSLFEDL